MYEPGHVIDRNYRVSRRLALGGSGVTYLVRTLDDANEETGPWIALKLLFASRDRGAYLRRLSNEAQILQELHHPHIVEYLGFVHRTGQSPYLMTRFEEGGSLLDHMKRVGTMGVREAAEVGRQVCQALAKGHSQGITHRDLKPENLLLAEITPKGDPPTIRVADFGIAKVSGSLGSGITRAGAFVGTPQYAAPEQFLGHAASPKADVYSLGAVMIFMMTARPLVPGAHTMAPEDAYTSLLDALPPSIHRPSDSPDDCLAMNRALDAAMSLEPNQRCTVDELETMLTALLDGVTEAGLEQHTLLGLSTSDSATVQGIDWGDRSLKANPTPTLKDVPSEAGAATNSADSRTAARPSRRWLRLGGVLAALVFSVAWWRVPWWFDALPGISAPASGVAGAESAIDRAYRDARPAIRTSCKGVTGSYATFDIAIDANGEIRWARVVAAEKNVSSAQCFARKLRGAESGRTLTKAAKARLRLRL